MWILPKQQGASPLFWEVLDENELFCKLKYRSVPIPPAALFLSLTKAITQPATYKIILKRSGEPWTIATSENFDVIEKHWKYVCDQLLPMARQISDDLEEAYKFVINRITALAALEEGEEGKDERKIENFHERFKDLATEKLVTYYDAAIWRQGSLTPSPGTMYITEHYICFDEGGPAHIGATAINMKEISKISKETTLGLTGNSIKIVMVDDSALWFVLLKRDAAFEVMDKLWQQSIDRLHKKLDPEAQGRSPTAQTSKAQLDQMKRSEEFRALFRVPDELVSEYSCSFWPNNDVLVSGTAYVSDNFLCFQASGVPLKFVLAWKNIASLEKRGLVLGIVQNAIQAVTKDGRDFFFVFPRRRDETYAEFERLWSSRLQYAKRQEERFAPIPNRDGWKLDKNRTESAEYQQRESATKAAWDHYFEQHGFGSSMIVAEEFDNLIKETAVPDCYRGFLWAFTSGALRKLEANPGYYQDVLEKSKEKPVTEAMNEIDKDVTRSMPGHPFFQQKESLEALRNILVAYSERSPHIGYCQAMNIVAAALLLYMSEEETFWTLATLAEEISPDYYSKQLLGSIVDQKIFAELVHKYQAEVEAHLLEVALPLEIISLAWFMCYFIDYIPWQATLRVMDNLLHTGTHVLFQVGLAFLHLHKADIIQEHDAEGVTMVMKTKPVDSVELLETAFIRYGHLELSKITHMRNQQKFKKLQDIEKASIQALIANIRKKWPRLKEEEVIHMYDRWEALNGGSGLRKEDLLFLIRELLPHFSTSTIAEGEHVETHSATTPQPQATAPSISLASSSYQSQPYSASQSQVYPQHQYQPQPQYHPHPPAPSAPVLQTNQYAYAPNSYPSGAYSSYPTQPYPYSYNPAAQSQQYPAPYSYSFDGRTVTINPANSAPHGNGYYLFYPPRQNVGPIQYQQISPVMTGVPAIQSAAGHQNTLAPPAHHQTGSHGSSTGTSSPNRSPSPSRRGNESPLSTSTNTSAGSTFDDEIIELIFKHYGKGSSGAHLITFESFAEIIAMSYRGSLEDQFLFAFRVVKGTNSITKDEFLTVLKLMYRLGYDGDTPFSRNVVKLKGFVGVIWDQLHHLGSGPVDYNTLHHLVIKRGLLEDFWTQLYVQ